MPSWVLDALVGWCFCLLGSAAWQRKYPATSVLMAAVGLLWFTGGGAGLLVFAHRGPLIHLLIGYPQGRLRDRAARAVVAVAYLDALVYPIGRSAVATVALALSVCAVAARNYRRARGAERGPRLIALSAAVGVMGVLSIAGVSRLSGAHIDQGLLMAYEVTLIAVALALFADFRWGRWDVAAINTLAVDLGRDAPSASLRDRLAAALGDPTLVLGYVTPESESLVDESGRPIEVETAWGPGRVVTTIRDAETPIAVLAHDVGVVDDPALLHSVTALTKIALMNLRLQTEVQDRAAQVAASRLRLVTVADAQRARLAADVHAGPEVRLDRVAGLLLDHPELATGLRSQVVSTRTAIRDFARGIHPRTLTELGLSAAIAELVEAAPVPVEVRIPSRRFERSIEAVAYFVCAEAMTNIAKYSQATEARIEITPRPGELSVNIADNGVGGAEPSTGSGLIGLTDRLDILGGSLRVDSPPAQGTRLTASIPLPDP